MLCIYQTAGAYANAKGLRGGIKNINRKCFENRHVLVRGYFKTENSDHVAW